MVQHRVEEVITMDPRDRADLAWKLLTNFGGFPAIMSNVTRVVVTHSGGEGYGESEWFVDIEGAPLRWKERDRIDPQARRIDFEAFEGDFETFVGSWNLEQPGPRELRIRCSVTYDLGIPVIDEVLGHILEEKMSTNLRAMLLAIRDRLTS